MQVSVTEEHIIFKSVENTLNVRKSHKQDIVNFLKGNIEECVVTTNSKVITFYKNNKVKVLINGNEVMKDHIDDVRSCISVLTTGFNNLPFDILSSITDFVEDRYLHKITSLHRDFSKELKMLKSTESMTFLIDRNYRNAFVKTHPNVLLDIWVTGYEQKSLDEGIANVSSVNLTNVVSIGSFDEKLVSARFDCCRFTSIKGLPRTIKEVKLLHCRENIQDLDHIKNCERFTLSSGSDHKPLAIHVSLINFKFLKYLDLTRVTVEFPVAFEHLEEVKFEQVHVDNISSFINVKKLTLYDCDIANLEFSGRLEDLTYTHRSFRNMSFSNIWSLKQLKLKYDEFDEFEELEESKEFVSISNCPMLEEVNLENFKEVDIQDCPNVKSLNATRCSKITNLELLSGLERVYFDECEDIILPGKHYKRLKFVRCIAQNLDNVSTDVMNITYREDFDISTIHCSEKLKLAVKVPVDLSYFGHLKSVSFRNCPLTSLKSIKDVESIEINGCNIKTWDSFGMLEGGKVKKLDICGNTDIRILTLPPLDNLIELNTTHNHVYELPSFPNLKILRAQNNKLDEVPLMSNLEYVDLSRNHLTSLRGLKNVKTVIIRECNLKSLKGLGNNLHVDCSKNDITDLTPVKNVPIVIAEYNKITNADVMANAKELNIRYNPIGSIEALKNVKKLRR